MSVTDQQVMNEIQLTMIEPPDNGATWPSGLWTQDEVIGYMNQRQNRFLKDTLVQIGIANITTQIGVGTYDLPDDWINTVRVLMIRSDNTTKELARSDTWEADHGIPTWSYVVDEPKLYYDGGTPLTVRLMPIPEAVYTLQIHYTPLGAVLDGTGELLTLPDEMIPTIKYGALADMFSKVGRANDANRAKYCEDRFMLGVEITRMLLGGFKG